MADYKGKFTGQQVDDTLQQAIDDHGKVAALKKKVEELEGGSSSVIAIESKTYTNLSTSEKTGKVFVVYKASGSSEEPTPQPTYYTITRNLSNVTSSNSSSSVVGGASYTANLSALSGYTLSSVVVTMNGVDVTSSSYSNGVINIGNVVGNIVITAVATQNQQEPTTYSIVKNLENCYISNNATTIVQGSNYSATITPNDGYNLDVVTCTMGGANVSVSNGVISIPSVSGNIVINASASVVVPTPSFVEFNDDLAKSIAVSHWDTDGDGEISKSEASNISLVGASNGSSYFANQAITNVDWINNFSGVTSLWGAFKNCTSISSLDIDITAAKCQYFNDMFSGCSGITTARFHFNTNGKLDRFAGVFLNCKNMVSCDISGSDFSNVGSLANTFSGCEKLEMLDMSYIDLTTIKSKLDSGFAEGNLLGYKGSSLFTKCNSLREIKMNGCNSSTMQIIERCLDIEELSSNVTIVCDGVNHTYNGSSWT